MATLHFLSVWGRAHGTRLWKSVYRVMSEQRELSPPETQSTLTRPTELVLLQSSLGRRISVAQCDLGSIMQQGKPAEVNPHPAPLSGAPDLLRTHSSDWSILYFQDLSPSAHREMKMRHPGLGETAFISRGVNSQMNDGGLMWWADAVFCSCALTKIPCMCPCLHAFVKLEKLMAMARMYHLEVSNMGKMMLQKAFLTEGIMTCYSRGSTGVCYTMDEGWIRSHFFKKSNSN